MNVVRLASQTDFAGWRAAARRLAVAGVAPEAVEWRVGDEPSLLEADAAPDESAPARPALRVPAAFLRLAQDVNLHRDPQRFALCYRILVRLETEPRLLEVASDVDVARAFLMQKAIARDIHKMHAYVRFREARMDDGQVFIAWFEPSHYVVQASAPFFVRRFATMRWAILTPDASAWWDGALLRFGPGARRADAPEGDALEALWRTYYASIFNPARLKTSTMQAQMPKKYWANLPEAQLIPELIGNASQRTHEMIAAQASTPRRRIVLSPRPVPAAAPAGTLQALRAQAARCRNCPLWEHATQTVFGEGPAHARVMLVGEQPGDREDLAGRPFVGPAGALLDRALAAAGIDRDAVYLTNAVKHFKYAARGKRRLHRTPGRIEIDACRDWLEAELDRVGPKLLVAMGGTALAALTGARGGLLAMRGRVVPWRDHAALLVTVHPSYLLRIPQQAQDAEFAGFVADLALALDYVGDAAAG